MNVTLTLVETILTDGSSAFDVKIGGITLACVTQRDAERLLGKLSCAIEAHTLATAYTDFDLEDVTDDQDARDEAKWLARMGGDLEA